MNDRIDIQFKGLTTSPSDYACGDGEMAVCHNLVVKDGELASFYAPEELPFSKTSDGYVLCVHRVAAEKHLIVYEESEDSVFAWHVDDDYNKVKDGHSCELPYAFGRPISVEAVGNVLVLAYEDGMKYYRWTMGAYKYLGAGLPELPKLRFGLHTLSLGASYNTAYEKEYPKYKSVGNVVSTVTVDYKTTESSITMSDEAESVVYNASMGLLGELKNKASKVGAFVYPFLVRYCFRLYDGTTTKVSPPVLMVPSDLPPILMCTSSDSDKLQLSALCRPSFLRHMVVGSSDYSAWEDLITGIDVFVSSPIYTVHQDMSAEEYHEYLVSLGNTVRHPSIYMHPSYDGIGMSKYYGCLDTPGRLTGGTYVYPKLSDAGMVAKTEFTLTQRDRPAAPSGQSGFSGEFMAPLFTPAEVRGALESIASFYHVGTIPLSDLTKGDIRNDKGVKIDTAFVKTPIVGLDTLEARESLKEDYLDNYNTKAREVFSYNNRLIKADCTRDYTTEFDIGSMLQYIHASDFTEKQCFVKLRKGGNEYYARAGNGLLSGGTTYATWLAYHDPDATEYLILTSSTPSSRTYLRIPLHKHPLMQCAYWETKDITEVLKMSTSDWESVTASVGSDGKDSVLIGTEATDIGLQSSIYTSEVNNPFVFPSRYASTVGSGTILRLASATRPLSEGQFGAFPVMAFTDEGVWALSVNSEGVLSFVQPITREVLISKDGLCNLDNALCFVTRDGVNIIEGSTVTRISDVIKMPSAGFGGAVSASSLSALGIVDVPFDAVADAKNKVPVYSSLWKRLYLFDKTSTLTLSFDFESRAWTTMSMGSMKVETVTEDYPNVLVSFNPPQTYNLNDEGGKKGASYLFTRPMRFGSHDVPKTIMEEVVRGYFNRSVAVSAVTPSVPSPPTPSPGLTVSAAGPLTPGPPYVSSIACDICQVLYGSNDLRNWYVVNSSRDQYLRGRFGTPYKYFRLLVIAPRGLGKDKRITGASLEVQQRLNNTLR